MTPFDTHISSETQPHLDRLCEVIAAHGPMAVAFSGGVDSGLLAFVAHRVLGDGLRCVVGFSPSFARSESDHATEFLRRHGIPFERVETHEGDDPGYRANAGDRCYFCKDELFVRMRDCVDAERYPVIAYGANSDDAGDYRPGARAAVRHGVVAPLAEAGFGKDLVRRVARQLRLDLWDKPAAPCLASRIPHFSEVTPEKLLQVERAEALVRASGFRECRVRHHGETARIEVPCDDLPRLREPRTWSELENGIAALGFKQVEWETEGLRSGRLNDALASPRSLDMDPGL